jgi:hypothetical protein
MQVDVVDDGECAGTDGVADGAWIRRRRSQVLRGSGDEIGGLRRAIEEEEWMRRSRRGRR